MKLRGKVIKTFNDKDTKKVYTPKDDYKDADVFEADRPRYEELYYKGYVEKGELVEDNNRLQIKEFKRDN